MPNVSEDASLAIFFHCLLMQVFHDVNAAFGADL
jgi:hypothetical protein